MDAALYQNLLAKGWDAEDARLFAEWDELPQASRGFQEKVDSQTAVNAALSHPGPVRDVHDRIMSMPRDEFEAEFAATLNADAYDDWAAAEPDDENSGERPTLEQSAQAYLDRDERLRRERE